MEIKVVHTDHIDLLALVEKLDVFFDMKWGQTIAKQYQSQHQLSKMFYAVICYDGTLPVGCGCLKKIDEQIVEIKRMYVEPSYRRHGIATQILNALEKHAISLGYQIAELETGKEMLDNISFYQKCGYQIVDNYGDFINDDVCICMQKRLK